jgi:hypothetical protein
LGRDVVHGLEVYVLFLILAHQGHLIGGMWPEFILHLAVVDPRGSCGISGVVGRLVGCGVIGVT